MVEQEASLKRKRFLGVPSLTARISIGTGSIVKGIARDIKDISLFRKRDHLDDTIDRIMGKK